jgi:hypothetical protein
MGSPKWEKLQMDKAHVNAFMRQPTSRDNSTIISLKFIIANWNIKLQQQANTAYKFVDLVKQHDRIVDPDDLQTLDDTSGHCANVRPAMASDIRLIATASQGYAK